MVRDQKTPGVVEVAENGALSLPAGDVRAQQKIDHDAHVGIVRISVGEQPAWRGIGFLPLPLVVAHCQPLRPAVSVPFRWALGKAESGRAVPVNDGSIAATVKEEEIITAQWKKPGGRDWRGARLLPMPVAS